MKYPDDETFPQFYVNYVKLDRVPKFDEDWTPILQGHARRRFLTFERRSAVAPKPAASPIAAAISPPKPPPKPAR